MTRTTRSHVVVYEGETPIASVFTSPEERGWNRRETASRAVGQDCRWFYHLLTDRWRLCLTNDGNALPCVGYARRFALAPPK
jgi:hypothetical protein